MEKPKRDRRIPLMGVTGMEYGLITTGLVVAFLGGAFALFASVDLGGWLVAAQNLSTSAR